MLTMVKLLFYNLLSLPRTFHFDRIPLSRTAIGQLRLPVSNENSFLHDPRTLQTARSDRWWNFPTSTRGILNALGICLLLGGFLALFMGWPIHTCKSIHEVSAI